MSWLSNFLGLKKVKLPKVEEAEEIDPELNPDAYLKKLARKSGFEKQLFAGSKLAPKSYLGVR